MRRRNEPHSITEYLIDSLTCAREIGFVIVKVEHAARHKPRPQDFAGVPDALVLIAVDMSESDLVEIFGHRRRKYPDVIVRVRYSRHDFLDRGFGHSADLITVHVIRP